MTQSREKKKKKKSMSHSFTIAPACKKVSICFQSIFSRRVMGDVTTKLELVWNVKDTELFIPHLLALIFIPFSKGLQTKKPSE